MLRWSNPIGQRQSGSCSCGTHSQSLHNFETAQGGQPRWTFGPTCASIKSLRRDLTCDNNFTRPFRRARAMLEYQQQSENSAACPRYSVRIPYAVETA
eukprot:5375827-Pleurochrysis_carterae.AAC.2